VRRFLELQGPDLNEGLVLREYVELEPLVALDYWPDCGYGDSRPSLDEFTEIAKTIPSRFFTMDVALRTTGEWIIVELGGGQVSGLPD